MIVKLFNREDPTITKEIQDVADLDAVLSVDGDLCMKVVTAAGWMSLYPLIDWQIEVRGGYTHENRLHKPRGSDPILAQWKDDIDKQIDESVAYPHLRSDYKVCRTQLGDCMYVIDEIPAADVVKVVRCKDCDTYNSRGFPDGYGVCMAIDFYGTVVPEDFFCKYGRRVDNGPEIQETV